MKINAVGFGTLCAYVQGMRSPHDETMSRYAIEDLQSRVLAAIEEPVAPPPVMMDRATEESVKALLAACERGYKIEMIKAYRMLTGVGLKESKDAIESFNFPQLN